MSGQSISVIIPSRNRLQLLNRALASVAAQTAAPVEVIVIDNASEVPIRPEDLCTPARILRNERMELVAVNRNLGWQAATGSIVCFLDDDDWYLPGKCQNVLQAFEADPQLRFVYGRTSQIGPDGAEMHLSYGPPELPVFLLYRYIHCNALAVRCNLRDEILFNPEMVTYEDVEFIGRLLRGGGGLGIAQTHAVWMRDDRPDQITQKNLPRAFHNTLRLYTEFAAEIRASRALQRYYGRRLTLLAVYMRAPVAALRAAGTWARGITGV